MMTIEFSIKERKPAIVLMLLAFAFIIMTLVQDFLRSDLQKSAFYLSESLLFSSFWCFFAPCLFIQYLAVKYTNKKNIAFQITLVLVPFLFHLLLFPLLVWGLSAILYYHTYPFKQTFRYTLAEYLYLLVLFYTIPFFLYQFFLNKEKTVTNAPETKKESGLSRFTTSLLVADGYKKYRIAVAEILYFSANTPYINIHLENKKYLHPETLKSVAAQLDPGQFIRIHKSTIVNIRMVTTYTSRLNGDYDLTLKNNQQLRVSRNFAIDFKNLFNETHPLTTK